MQHVIKLNLDEGQIDIDICHRFGPSVRGKPRSTIVRFLRYKHRQLVWTNRRKLKGSEVFVNESFAGEIRQKRKVLWPFVKNARKVGSKAYLSVDKLVIDGKRYSYEKIDEVPLIYKPSHTVTEGNTVIFFTDKSPLSNFYKCKFTINDVSYTSVEQYYAYKSAVFFGDEDTANMIMNQKEAVEHKRSIKKIKGFDKTVWLKKEALNTVKEAMIAKFTQNPELGQYLKNTDDKEIGEANPGDYFWGTGMSLWAKGAAKTNNFK